MGWRLRVRRVLARVARARSVIDFELYRGTDRSTYYLGAFALVIGLLSWHWEGAGPVVATLGVGLSLGTFLLDRRSRRAAQDRLSVRRQPTLSLREVQLPAGVEVVRTSEGTALVWPAVDAALSAGQPLYAQWDRARYTLPPAIAEVAYDGLLRDFRGSAQPRFNGPVVRQGSDLDDSALAAHAPVKLSSATYFDLLCSNYSCSLDVFTAHDVLMLEGRELVVDRHGSLRQLATNRLANGVGVSTVAVTRDGGLVVVRQGSSAVSSPGRLAPSGSGSLEPMDIAGSVRRMGGETLLAEVIAAGMERELSEELNVAPDEIVRTSVTGYFRWFENGAKPEYVGVSVLDVDAGDLRERPRRRTERAYVAEVKILEPSDLDLVRLAGHPRDVESLLAPVLARLRCRASVPLLVALRALATALSEANPSSAKLRSAVLL